MANIKSNPKQEAVSKMLTNNIEWHLSEHICVDSFGAAWITDPFLPENHLQQREVFVFCSSSVLGNPHSLWILLSNQPN